MANTVSGGIIDIEHSNDGGSSYTVVGKTRGTVSWSPNTNVAESSNDHSSKHSDRAAVGEAWEIGFEGKVLSTLGGLDSLGVYDSANSEMDGSHDVPASSSEEFRVTVYEDADAKDAGTVTLQITVADYLLLLSAWNMEPDGFHTWECTVHARETPTVATS